MSFVKVRRGSAPLILSIPHAGTEIPEALQPALRSLWLARKDADWWLPELYAFAEKLDATIIRTDISRTVIEVNRDPSGASLYPGQTTTELCPTTTFDGEPLYRPRQAPAAGDTTARPRPFLRALARSASRRDRASPPEASARGFVRRPFHSLNHSAPVRWRAARVQSGHELRRKLRPRTAQDDWRDAGGERANVHHRWALQGRLDHARLWAYKRRRP